MIHVAILVVAAVDTINSAIVEINIGNNVVADDVLAAGCCCRGKVNTITGISSPLVAVKHFLDAVFFDHFVGNASRSEKDTISGAGVGPGRTLNSIAAHGCVPAVQIINTVKIKITNVGSENHVAGVVRRNAVSAKRCVVIASIHRAITPDVITPLVTGICAAGARRTERNWDLRGGRSVYRCTEGTVIETVVVCLVP